MQRALIMTIKTISKLPSSGDKSRQQNAILSNGWECFKNALVLFADLCVTHSSDNQLSFPSAGLTCPGLALDWDSFQPKSAQRCVLGSDLKESEISESSDLLQGNFVSHPSEQALLLILQTSERLYYWFVSHGMTKHHQIM